MPSKRERLRMLMRLKSQRQLLGLGLAVSATLSAALGVSLWQEQSSPEIVKLGAGKASIDAQPVASFEPAPVPAPSPSESSIGSGEASYYGDRFAGNLTANGETFDPERLTAAHRTLPMGSKVRVTNPRNGESVVVRINDRGPFHGNRVIDLSKSAARTIGLIRSGTGQVRMALLLD